MHGKMSYQIHTYYVVNKMRYMTKAINNLCIMFVLFRLMSRWWYHFRGTSSSQPKKINRNIKHFNSHKCNTYFIWWAVIGIFSAKYYCNILSRDIIVLFPRIHYTEAEYKVQRTVQKGCLFTLTLGSLMLPPM